jgi:hypothetical protein
MRGAIIAAHGPMSKREEGHFILKKDVSNDTKR